MAYQTPRGTVDILPEDQPYWNRVKVAGHEIARRFGYRQIDTPIFEDASLFVRGVGEGTDIVEKEMYTFEDRSGDLMTLRPEGTAPVCRAYIQHGMQALPQPVRLFYITPIFRYERPQAGRYRQHWQFGCEALGDPDPVVDTEVIQLVWAYMRELGLRDLTLQLNSIGDSESRPAYLQKLVEYYAPHTSAICGDCRVRIEKNPLRLLDCKVESCQPIIQDAPHITDYLNEASQQHFDKLRRYLDLSDIPYVINHRLVRGLDYYTRTVFEVFPEREGSQSAVAAGGRYDGLIEQLGGKPTPGVGFGSGIERAVLELKRQEEANIEPGRMDAFFVHMGEQPKEAATWLASQLRQRGISAQVATGERSLRAQMRAANQANARFALIIGDDEMAGSTVQEVRPMVRDLSTGAQQTMGLEEIVSALTRTA